VLELASSALSTNHLHSGGFTIFTSTLNVYGLAGSLTGSYVDVYTACWLYVNTKPSPWPPVIRVWELSVSTEVVAKPNVKVSVEPLSPRLISYLFPLTSVADRGICPFPVGHIGGARNGHRP
jgi:hypothetical protein